MTGNAHHYSVEGDGLPDVEPVILNAGATMREIVAAVAGKTGLSVEEVFLFVEDSDEPRRAPRHAGAKVT
jgi:hypothetical protein